MTSIYSDDQRQSLMNSMTNPESNAVKFLEQGGETGLSPDITMDILNKYATYGANTGIGNIGGSRLVDALNEEYRKQVDAPLQSSSPKAFDGASTSRLQQQQQQLLQQQQQQQTIQDLMTTPVAPVSDPSLVPTEEMKADLDDALANPVELGQLSPTETAVQEGIDKDVNPEISPITIVDGEEGRISKLKKYLKDNPLLAEQLMKSGASLGSILGKAAVGNDKGGRTPRAPRGGQKASRVTYAPIGMQAGGETAGAEGAAGPNAGLMAILQALGSILGQSLVGRDKILTKASSKRLFKVCSEKVGIRHSLNEAQENRIVSNWKWMKTVKREKFKTWSSGHKPGIARNIPTLRGHGASLFRLFGIQQSKVASSMFGRAFTAPKFGALIGSMVTNPMSLMRGRSSVVKLLTANKLMSQVPADQYLFPPWEFVDDSWYLTACILNEVDEDDDTGVLYNYIIKRKHVL